MSESPHYLVYAILAGVIILAIELNALKGKTGPMTSVKGVITWGFVLTAVLYGLLEFCH